MENLTPQQKLIGTQIIQENGWMCLDSFLKAMPGSGAKLIKYLKANY